MHNGVYIFSFFTLQLWNEEGDNTLHGDQALQQKAQKKLQDKGKWTSSPQSFQGQDDGHSLVC